jgi:hypothetical protein
MLQGLKITANLKILVIYTTYVVKPSEREIKNPPLYSRKVKNPNLKEMICNASSSRNNVLCKTTTVAGGSPLCRPDFVSYP